MDDNERRIKERQMILDFIKDILELAIPVVLLLLLAKGAL